MRLKNKFILIGNISNYINYKVLILRLHWLTSNKPHASTIKLFNNDILTIPPLRTLFKLKFTLSSLYKDLRDNLNSKLSATYSIMLPFKLTFTLLVKSKGKVLNKAILELTGSISKLYNTHGIKIMKAKRIGNSTVQQKDISWSKRILGNDALTQIKEKINKLDFIPRHNPSKNPTNIILGLDKRSSRKNLPSLIYQNSKNK